jgi:hypothetical protein
MPIIPTSHGISSHKFLRALGMSLLLVGCASRAPTPDELGRAACARLKATVFVTEATSGDLTQCFAYSLREALEQP